MNLLLLIVLTDGLLLQYAICEDEELVIEGRKDTDKVYKDKYTMLGRDTLLLFLIYI